MGIVATDIDTEFKGQRYAGRLVHDDSSTAPKPGVLVGHAWGGRGGFDDEFADTLASEGYVAIAIDLYGVGIRGNTREECQALIAPYKHDRLLLQDHLLNWHQLLRDRPEVDSDNTAMVGFCFGGLCALDLARTGASVKATVSFHGLLGEPETVREQGSSVQSDILVLHGWDDPMATPADVLAFAEEMKQRHACWDLHVYGNTLHAFTNPNANDADFGTVYSATADRRSREAMQGFLREAFNTDGDRT